MTQNVPTLQKKGRLQSMNVVQNLMQYQKAERHKVASTCQPLSLVAGGVAEGARRSVSREIILVPSARLGAKNFNLPDKELGGKSKDLEILPDYSQDCIMYSNQIIFRLSLVYSD